MLAILAPSKTQKAFGTSPLPTSHPFFWEKSCELINIVGELSLQELAGLMKTSDKLTTKTRDQITSFSKVQDNNTSHPAIFSFQGDAYNSMSPETWSEDQMKYAQNHLAILSGLYGILRPLDLMQSYRLEMGLKLATHRGKNMYQYWGESIAHRINEQQKGHSEKVIINLASTEYSQAINKGVLEGGIIDIVFTQTKSGKTKTIPIYSKRARGAMANFMVKNQLSTSVGLKDFAEDGYQFIESESDEKRWVFHLPID